MEAVRTHTDVSPMAWLDEPIIDADFMSKPLHTVDEFFDKLCKELGEAYGLNDIRDAE